MSHPLFMVDVFAETKYAGNQLAVVGDAGKMSRQEMQRIARETNFSETTFLVSERREGPSFDVRIFTPAREIPFAGHPTLGTAWVLRNEVFREEWDEVTLNLGAGPIKVRFVDPGGERGVLWMEQAPPRFGSQVDGGAIAGVLGLDPRDVDDRFPAEEVSTGMPFLIVPLRSLEALRGARVDHVAYEELGRAHDVKSILCFCAQTAEARNQIHARMFAPAFGIEEDPATGSAAGCLGGFLVRHRYFGGDAVDVRMEQGYEIARPSLLRVRARERRESITVEVGGKVVLVARGELI